MGRHARGHEQVTFLDTLAAYWTLFVAWFSLFRRVGRHEPADDRTPAAVLIAEPARFNWPGAEPDWALRIREWNEETVVLSPEVRA